MRDVFAVLTIACVGFFFLAAGCSSAPPSAPVRSSSAALAPATAGGDSADTSCQVVLRHTYINFESSLGPQTDCSSGTCWVVITVTFDVAMSQALAESEAFVLYQGEGSTAWEQSAQAQPTFGAPEGFLRYQVVLNTDTFTNGPGDTTVSLIPFLVTFGQSYGRVFDHNRVADPLGSYALTPLDNWTINDDASACPGATPAGTLALTFATGWANSSAGSLVGSGKLDVSYDVYRMPSVLTCTTDGVDAFAISGYVQFHPSGTVLTEVATGPLDATTDKIVSLPLEFDVPAGTTSASLWFEGGSDCAGPVWDSDFGQNYNYSAP
jgi:hypothetical protein